MSMSPTVISDPAAASVGAKRVLVVDDHRLACEAIASALEADCGYDVDWVVEAGHLLEKLGGGDYDLILLDTRLPDPIGMGLVRQVLGKAGDAPLLLLVEQARRQFWISASFEGAAGMIEKKSALQVLINVVEIVMAGGEYVPAHIVGERDDYVDAEAKICREEQNVLACASEGYSDKEISIDTQLKISQVKNLFLNVRAKLCARNRTHAVMIAQERGII